MLHKYKDIFGKPNENLHAYRLFNYAIIDIFFTLLFSIIIIFILHKFNLITFSIQNIFISFIVLIILSVFIHILFGVDTKLVIQIKNLIK